MSPLEVPAVTDPTLRALGLAAGTVLLVAGRKLFWFFVGAAGFILGLTLIGRLELQPVWLELALALLVGAAAAWAAIVVQKLAVVLAGFVVGGYAVHLLLPRLDPGLDPWRGFLILAGAILGAILILAVFEAALIFLSAMAGAALIVQAAGFDADANPTLRLLAFVVLLAVGLVVQTGTRKKTE